MFSNFEINQNFMFYVLEEKVQEQTPIEYQPMKPLDIKFEEKLFESSVEDPQIQTNENSQSINHQEQPENVDYNIMVNEIINLCQGEQKDDDLIRSRRKLRKREIQLLEKEYKKNPNWTKENIQEIATQFNLPYYKVYKWNWDNKRKIKDISEDTSVSLGKRSREHSEEFSRGLCKRPK